MGRPYRDVSWQLIENKALSWGIIRKSACILAEITIRKSQVFASHRVGFDHGVGHPLLLLYDAKAPLGKNSNYFNGLGHDLSNPSVSLF